MPGQAGVDGAEFFNGGGPVDAGKVKDNIRVPERPGQTLSGVPDFERQDLNV
jgi:hypothetical protein